jgi:hypothetical protein
MKGVEFSLADENGIFPLKKGCSLYGCLSNR